MLKRDFLLEIGIMASLIALLAIVLAVPAPPNVPPPLPNISGVCTCGTVIQKGDKVWIEGRTDWSAEGKIGGDIVFRWKFCDKFAEGTYRLDGRTLVGHWHWEGSDALMPESIEIRDGIAETPEF